MDILIRPTLPADAQALIGLSHRTIRACYTPFLGDAAVDGFLNSGAADQYVLDNLAETTVITRDGNIAGFTVCRGHLIDLMMIDTMYHRQGLGAKLLAHVEASLFLSHTELQLESFAENHVANAFYRKHGWTSVDEFFDNDSGVNKLAFVKNRHDAIERNC